MIKQKILRSSYLAMFIFFIVVGCQQDAMKQITPSTTNSFKLPSDLFNNPGAGGSIQLKSKAGSRDASCAYIPVGNLSLKYQWTQGGTNPCVDPVFNKAYPNNQYYVAADNMTYGFCVTITNGGVLDGYLGNGSTFPFAGGTYNCANGGVIVPFLSTASVITGYIIPWDQCGSQVPEARVDFSFRIPSSAPASFNTSTKTLSWTAVPGATGYRLTTPGAGVSDYTTSSTSISNAVTTLHLGSGAYTTTIYPLFSCGQGVGYSYSYNTNAVAVTIQTIYIAGSYNYTMYYSIDNGANWTAIQGTTLPVNTLGNYYMFKAVVTNAPGNQSQATLSLIDWETVSSPPDYIIPIGESLTLTNTFAKVINNSITVTLKAVPTP